MKISTEQIREIFVRNGFKLSNETGDDLKQYVYSAARELIALAQEVEPLKFDKIQNATLACSMFGTYSIEQVGGRYCFRVQRFYENRRFESEEEAIEAAQQDYANRVRSGLKYGGGE